MLTIKRLTRKKTAILVTVLIVVSSLAFIALANAQVTIENTSIGGGGGTKAASNRQMLGCGSTFFTIYATSGAVHLSASTNTGGTWTSPVAVNSQSTQQFVSAWCSSTAIAYAYFYSTTLYYDYGTISGTTVSWIAEQHVATNLTSGYVYISMTWDSGAAPWVAATDYNLGEEQVFHSALTNGSFNSNHQAVGFPAKIWPSSGHYGSCTGTATEPSISPLTSAKVAVVWTCGGNAVTARTWSGAVWNTLAVCGSSALDCNNPAGTFADVAIGDNLNVTLSSNACTGFGNGACLDYYGFTYPSTWSSATVLVKGYVGALMSLTKNATNRDLFFSWGIQSGSFIYTIDQMKFAHPALAWSSPTIFYSNTAGIQEWTFFYQTDLKQVGAGIYTSATSDPYVWDSLVESSYPVAYDLKGQFILNQNQGTPGFLNKGQFSLTQNQGTPSASEKGRLSLGQNQGTPSSSDKGKLSLSGSAGTSSSGDKGQFYLCGWAFSGATNHTFGNCPITEDVKATATGAATTQTVTVTACSVSPPTFLGDATQRAVSATATCVLTFTLPAGYKWAGSGSTTETATTCGFGVCSPGFVDTYTTLGPAALTLTWGAGISEAQFTYTATLQTSFTSPVNFDSGTAFSTYGVVTVSWLAQTANANTYQPLSDGTQVMLTGATASAFGGSSGTITFTASAGSATVNFFDPFGETVTAFLNGGTDLSGSVTITAVSGGYIYSVTGTTPTTWQIDYTTGSGTGPSGCQGVCGAPSGNQTTTTTSVSQTQTQAQSQTTQAGSPASGAGGVVYSCLTFGNCPIPGGSALAIVLLLALIFLLIILASTGRQKKKKGKSEVVTFERNGTGSTPDFRRSSR